MSLSTTLTERAAVFLDNTTNRRGFLNRAAMTGSAVAAAGVTYATRPTSAYAAVCGCNGRTCNCTDLCCDGYTEFCCQLNGNNSCPPNTILAGWWKVDNSSYCAGAARYYMDCNKSSPGCACGATGVCRDGTACQCRSCGNRKDGCTVFRYGNCNNHVSCVGPIMCRVVTCAKPWEIDPGCSTVARTDENTRHHTRVCLEMSESDRQAFVRALYQDFLGRSPDSSGLTYWTNQLRSHTANAAAARQVVAWSFAYSVEYMTRTVTSWYQLGLGRAPDRTGLDYWVQNLRSGVKPSIIATSIFAGAEFYKLSGNTDAGFVRRLYVRLLGREPSGSDVGYWTDELARGAGRDDVAFAVFQSLESRRRRVTSLYRLFLKRTPDATGRDYWAEHILRHEDVALSIYISAGEEYLAKAVQRYPS